MSAGKIMRIKHKTTYDDKYITDIKILHSVTVVI